MNKSTKGLLALIGVASLAVGGYSVLNRNDTVSSPQASAPELPGPQQTVADSEDTASLEEIVEDTQLVKGVSAEGQYKSINGPGYHLIADPIEAGQSSQLSVLDSINNQDPVEKIVLFEDGNEIFSTDKPLLTYEVTKQTEGTHAYTAELHTKSGQKIETESMEITFTGTPIDFLPRIESFHSSTLEAGKSTRILVTGKDIGDNKGIKRITLYEDDVPLETGGFVLRTIQYDSPQTHTYHAEIEDIGEQVVTTKKIRVSYSGEAFPPSVSWFGARSQEAGRTTQLLVEGKDGKNYDDLQGISRIVLYEDGQQIHEENDGSLFLEVTHDEAGNHEYHAEIYNGNGKKTTTKKVTVNFMGEDFHPEVKWWDVSYRPEKGLAQAVVQGKDEKNVRDDAGIQQIVLFEDGKPVKIVEGKTLFTDLMRQSGSHTYFAEITNNSGLTTKTGEVIVTYPAK